MLTKPRGPKGSPVGVWQPSWPSLPSESQRLDPKPLRALFGVTSNECHKGVGALRFLGCCLTQPCLTCSHGGCNSRGSVGREGLQLLGLSLPGLAQGGAVMRRVLGGRAFILPKGPSLAPQQFGEELDAPWSQFLPAAAEVSSSNPSSSSQCHLLLL